MTELTRDFLKELRGQAHGLSPVVMVGQSGLSDGVLAAIEDALEAHELIKVKMLDDDRDQRAAWIEQILEVSGAAKVLAVGKMLSIYRKRKPKKDRDLPD